MSGGSRLYDDPERASAYARISATNAANAAYERPAMRALLGNARDLDVLDAGCADGQHSAWLADRGARVVALDASEAMVRLARERLGERARVLQADLTRPLPLPDASADVILSSLTLHYLEDWNAPLREFSRVLRPGGRLIVSMHHPFMTANDVDDYHAVAMVEETWRGFGTPVAVRYYHRPLARIVADLLAAGFALRGMHEPQPTGEADARDPQLAQRFRTRPGFLIVEAESARR